MAEYKYGFQEVMRHARRMCVKYSSCENCPLAYAKCVASPDEWDNEDIATFERIVLRWVAMNREPQYPSWREWIEDTQYQYRGYDSLISWMNNTPIPADIAEKLGVKPKEKQR